MNPKEYFSLDLKSIDEHIFGLRQLLNKGHKNPYVLERWERLLHRYECKKQGLSSVKTVKNDTHTKQKTKPENRLMLIECNKQNGSVSTAKKTKKVDTGSNNILNTFPVKAIYRGKPVEIVDLKERIYAELSSEFEGKKYIWIGDKDLVCELA